MVIYLKWESIYYEINTKQGWVVEEIVMEI